MTLMIPSTIVRPQTPGGEKRLFKLLQGAQGTEHWVALHSFDIAKHETKTSSEVDMILIIPDAGILFIEVKGVGVSRTDGKWRYSDGRPPDAGPFVQASTAMHSIRITLSKLYPDSSSLMYFSAVVFPEFDFHLPASPLEWHDWQVIDKKKLQSGDIASLFRGVLEKAHKHMASVGKRWYDPETSRPSKILSEKLAAFLRPNFSFGPSERSAIHFIEETIQSYTIEQLMTLDSFDDNDRMMVTGPAGTGKTVVASEAFKRAVRSGRKVLFLCFNRFLGIRLQNEMEEFLRAEKATDRAQIHTFHSYLLNASQISVPENPTSDFWRQTLPDIAMEALLSNQASDKVLIEPDLLIVDEAQDLMLPSYLDCLETILNNDLAESNWLLLGDFKNQSIYEGNVRYLDEKCGNSYFKYTLTRNCRNAGQVAGQIKLLFGVQPSYRMTLPNLDGAEAKVDFWQNESDQANCLAVILRQYLRTFSPHEIQILSPLQNSPVIEKLKDELKPTLTKFDPTIQKNKGRITYSTIAAFKGLESPVVIITDLDDLSEESLTLLYVAISRAKACVRILLHNKCKKRYEELITEGFKR